LRHPAEIGVTELGHPVAAASKSCQHNFDRRRRNRMLLRHPLDEICVD
jgi:hypothetical protein